MIETTGVKSVIELAYNLTHPDGTCVLVGVPAEKVTIYTLPIHFNKVLTGSHGGDATPAYRHSAHHPAAKAGRISFEGIITDEFPLDDINAALVLGPQRQGRPRPPQARMTCHIDVARRPAGMAGARHEGCRRRYFSRLARYLSISTSEIWCR